MAQLAVAASRLGTETAFDVLAQAKALEAQGFPLINLGIGQPDFATPAHIVEAAVRALRDGQHGYTPANGLPALREAVAAYGAEQLGIHLDPARLLILPGAKVTMAFAVLLLAEPGTEVLYPDPGFPIYRSLVDFVGARAVPYSVKQSLNFSYQADEIQSKLNARTRLLILNSPHNPTGGIAAPEEMDRLAALLDSHPKVTLLSDEIYTGLVYEGQPHRSWLRYESLRDRVIWLDGASKRYAMTGWRLGWSYWPASLIEPATRLAINIHSCVNTATQFAGIAALTGPQDSVAAMRTAFDERRQVLVSGLNAIPGIRCATPLGAFYAYPDVSGLGLSGAALQHRLLHEAYIASVAGDSFGSASPNHIRLSYAASLEQIEAALARLRDWVDKRA